METINHIFLSGNLTRDAVFFIDEGQKWCKMTLKTFRSSKNGDKKVKIPEYHDVRGLFLSSLEPYLLRGKAVIIQGRIIPSTNTDDAYIMATSVTFPGSYTNE